MPRLVAVQRVTVLKTHTHAINRQGTKTRRYYEGKTYVAETDDEALAFGHMISQGWAEEVEKVDEGGAPKVPLGKSKKDLGAAPENKAAEAESQE